MSFSAFAFYIFYYDLNLSIPTLISHKTELAKMGKHAIARASKTTAFSIRLQQNV